MTDLLTRLREVEHTKGAYVGSDEPVTQWYRNPDGPEAADEIERLRDAVIRAEGELSLVMSEFQTGISACKAALANLAAPR